MERIPESSKEIAERYTELSFVTSSLPKSFLQKRCGHRRPRIQRPNDGYPCDAEGCECNQIFSKPKTLSSHRSRQKILRSAKNQCVKCGSLCDSPERLSSHMQAHLPYDQRSHRCDLCARMFCSPMSLKRHRVSKRGMCHLPKPARKAKSLRRKYKLCVVRRSLRQTYGLQMKLKLRASNGHSYCLLKGRYKLQPHPLSVIRLQKMRAFSPGRKGHMDYLQQYSTVSSD